MSRIRRIGLKNIQKCVKPFLSYDRMKSFKDMKPDLIEIYQAPKEINNSLILSYIQEYINSIQDTKIPKIQYHVNENNLDILTSLDINQMMTGLDDDTSYELDLWIEVPLVTIYTRKFFEIIVETFPPEGTKLVLNIIVPDFEDQYDIIRFFQTDEKGKEINKHLDEIYMVDRNLYKSNINQSKIFKLRERLIKTQPTKVNKYCTEENELYMVFDFDKDRYLPCIDLDENYCQTKLNIISFQQKEIPTEQCKYFCNKYIYDFEDKLKRKIK